MKEVQSYQNIRQIVITQNSYQKIHLTISNSRACCDIEIVCIVYRCVGLCVCAVICILASMVDYGAKCLRK